MDGEQATVFIPPFPQFDGLASLNNQLCAGLVDAECLYQLFSVKPLNSLSRVLVLRIFSYTPLQIPKNVEYKCIHIEFVKIEAVSSLCA
jgi:hypothetical protein